MRPRAAISAGHSPPCAVDPDRLHAGAAGALDVELRIVADVHHFMRLQVGAFDHLAEDRGIGLQGADVPRGDRALEKMRDADLGRDRRCRCSR